MEGSRGRERMTRRGWRISTMVLRISFYDTLCVRGPSLYSSPAILPRTIVIPVYASNEPCQKSLVRFVRQTNPPRRLT